VRIALAALGGVIYTVGAPFSGPLGLISSRDSPSTARSPAIGLDRVNTGARMELPAKRRLGASPAVSATCGSSI